MPSLVENALDSPRQEDKQQGTTKQQQQQQHTFGQVAIARGNKWAEASMAALHKKERAQALQILQLRQDLERAKAQLEASQREASELRVRQPRIMDAAPPPAADGAGGGLGGSSSNLALPSIPRDARASHSGSRSTSRTGSAHGGARTREPLPQPPARPSSKERATAREADGPPPPPRSPPPPQPPLGALGSSTEPVPSWPSCSPKMRTSNDTSHRTCLGPGGVEGAVGTESREALLERLHALETALEGERAAAANERAACAAAREELDHTRSELARLSSRYETRMSSSASLQHDLERRLSEAHADLDTARERLHALEAEGQAAREDVRRRTQSEADAALKVLRVENERLHTEVAALHQKPYPPTLPCPPLALPPSLALPSYPPL